MRSHIGVVPAAALMLLVGGCAHDLVVGDAKPSDTRVERPAQLSEVTPQEWPDACELLTDGEITALLPEHRDVERIPSPVTVYDADFLDGQDLGGEAANGSCEFVADHGNGDYVEITITIENVGSADVVRERYAADRNNALEQKTEYSVVRDVEGTGARACFSSGTDSYSTLDCAHRWLAFEVSTIGLGTVPDFSQEDTNQALTAQLAPRVVRTVVAKIR